MRRAVSSYCGIGSEVCSVRTPSARKPGSLAWTFQIARISRPLEMSSTSDATTSATTSVDRSRSLRRRPSERPRGARCGSTSPLDAQHRRDAEDQARQRGQDERKEHGADVHRRHVCGRKASRHERCQQRHREQGEHHAEAAAERREQKALGAS